VRLNRAAVRAALGSPCAAPDCHTIISQPQSGRRKRFCSDGCRIRVHRRNETPAEANGHPADLDAPSAFPAKTGSFVTSKINDLATPKNRASVSISGRGIVGPSYVIRAAVINSRDWEEVASPDGVVSYVSRIGRRALREGA
jgi:hypothetical protein